MAFIHSFKRFPSFSCRHHFHHSKRFPPKNHTLLHAFFTSKGEAHDRIDPLYTHLGIRVLFRRHAQRRKSRILNLGTSRIRRLITGQRFGTRSPAEVEHKVPVKGLEPGRQRSRGETFFGCIMFPANCVPLVRLNLIVHLSPPKDSFPG